MTAPPPPLEFVTEETPDYGVSATVSPLLRRIVCRNPSKFTGHGTGTFVIGHGTVAVVDPGPVDEEHLAAIRRAVAGERVDYVLVTHTHGDHSPAARPLAAETGATVLAFGPHPRGVSSDEERSDVDFVPDGELEHGARVDGPGWSVTALHTPGHMSNHLCFELHEERAILTGDHIMGWSTSIIPPPDGDVADYLASLALVRDRAPAVLHPTHGAPVRTPQRYVDALISHRLFRESQIIEALGSASRSPAQLVADIYVDLPEQLHDAAARSVIAHLAKLRDEGVAGPVDPAADWLDPTIEWSRR